MKGVKQANLPPSLPPRWCEENGKNHSHSTHKREQPLLTNNLTNERRTFFIIRSSSAFLVAQELLAVKSNLGDIKVCVARTENILNKIRSTNTNFDQQAQLVMEYAQNTKEVNKRKIRDVEAKMTSMKEFEYIKNKQNSLCNSTTATKNNSTVGGANNYFRNELSKYDKPNTFPTTMTNVRYSSQASPVCNEANIPVLPVQVMNNSSTNSYPQHPRYDHLCTENDTKWNANKDFSYQNNMHAMHGASSSSRPYQPL